MPRAVSGETVRAHAPNSPVPNLLRRRALVYIPGVTPAFLFVYSLISRLICRLRDILYRLGVLRAARPPLPVVCVGNISLGGSGKTPLVIEIASSLAAAGRKPAVVSRGYRGAWEKTGGVLSEGRRLLGSWREAGDEPVLIAERVPAAGVFVGRDRLASCRLAATRGFDVAVLDDGFQHRRLARDLDIVLYDPAERLALRESPAALRRASAIVIPSETPERARRRLRARLGAIPLFSAAVRPRGFVDLRSDETLPPAAFRGRRVVAFCAIARPGRFYDLLAELGAEIADFLVFPDHHDYPEASLERILAARDATDAAACLTTEKDAVKLVERGSFAAAGRVFALRIGIEVEPSLADFISTSLPQPAPCGPDGRP